MRPVCRRLPPAWGEVTEPLAEDCTCGLWSRPEPGSAGQPGTGQVSPAPALSTYRIHRSPQRSLGGTGSGWCWPPGICHRCGTHNHQGSLPQREGGASSVGVLEGGPSLAPRDRPIRATVHPPLHTPSVTVFARTPREALAPQPCSPATRTVPAVGAHEASGALAHVALVCVHTGAPILARGREAGVGTWGASCKTDSG